MLVLLIARVIDITRANFVKLCTRTEQEQGLSLLIKMATEYSN